MNSPPPRAPEDTQRAVPPRPSGLAVIGLVAATATLAIVAVGAIAMLFTFAGVCTPEDDCDSWKRRQLPIVVALAVVGGIGTVVAGLVAVVARRSRPSQLAFAFVALACALTGLAFEAIYFTR